jgi:hypothetical protein
MEGILSIVPDDLCQLELFCDVLIAGMCSSCHPQVTSLPENLKQNT